MAMDTLVPSFGTQPQAMLSCSTRVGSCSSQWSGYGDHMVAHGGGLAARCGDQSSSGSETFGMEITQQLTFETCKGDLCVKGFKSELEEKKKSKRRRDKINQKMKTLQKLVPNANKTDKASILDEVIEYVKQLEAQIHVMGRMNISTMMIPLAMQQQQLQMAMMNPMRMGIGAGLNMGMRMCMPGVMDLNVIGGCRPNIPGMPPVFHQSAFMQPMMALWDMQAAGDRVSSHNNDPRVALLACQSQPMTMEGYSRMAAFFQQMQNQSCYSALKN